MNNTLRRALREFLREFFGPFRTLVTNLVGEDGEKWSKELNKFLRMEECWTMPTSDRLSTRHVTLIKELDRLLESLSNDENDPKIDLNSVHAQRLRAVRVVGRTSHSLLHELAELEGATRYMCRGR